MDRIRQRECIVFVHAARAAMLVCCLSIIASPAQAVITKVNVVRTGDTTTTTVNMNLPAGSVAGLPFCPNVVAALVVNNFDGVDIVRMLQDGKSVSFDNEVNTTAQSLLQAEFQDPAYFDADHNDLYFLRLTPNTCVGETTFLIEYRVSDKFGELVLPTRLVAGGTEEGDLDHGPGLDNFALLDATVQGFPVPAISTWGGVALAMLLLIGAKTYFGRRRDASTTPS